MGGEKERVDGRRWGREKGWPRGGEIKGGRAKWRREGRK